MNPDDFLKQVSERSKETKSDTELAPFIDTINEHLSNLKSKMGKQNTQNEFAVFSNANRTATGAHFSGNFVQFNRTEISIDVSFRSEHDTEYSKAGQSIQLDSLKLEAGKLISTKTPSTPLNDVLNSFLPYLLA